MVLVKDGDETYLLRYFGSKESTLLLKLTEMC